MNSPDPWKPKTIYGTGEVVVYKDEEYVVTRTIMSTLLNLPDEAPEYYELRSERQNES